MGTYTVTTDKASVNVAGRTWEEGFVSGKICCASSLWSTFGYHLWLSALIFYSSFRTLEVYHQRYIRESDKV